MAEQYSWILANNEGYSAGKFSDVDGNIMPWSRSTVADGKWLNREMLLPFSGRDQYLLKSLNQTYDECSAFSGYLNEEIRIINARADVIDVVGSHDAFTARSAELVSGVDISDRDVIKILNDVGTDIPVWIYDTGNNVYVETAVSPSNQQTYYRWLSAVNDGPSGWEYVGDLEPYYKDIDLTENSITFENTAPERNYTVNTDTDKYIQMLVEGRTGTIGLTDEFISSASQVYNALSSISGINEGSISGPKVNHTVSNYSLAQGSANSASYDSFAQGKRNYANGQSIAAGIDNSAKSQSQALGNSNSADSNGFAAGSNNSAALAASFAQGSTNYAYNSSFAQGTSNSALTQSFAQGKNNSAYYDSFAQGLNATASTESLAQGQEAIADNRSLAQGYKCSAYDDAIAQGEYISANERSIAQGCNVSAHHNSFAQGYTAYAYDDSFAQGDYVSAKTIAFAQGRDASAYYHSFAQGKNTSADMEGFAQGNNAQASNQSFAQGYNITATTTGFAQGDNCKANNIALAQGQYASANDYSMAQGQKVYANYVSFAEGEVASAKSVSFAQGNDVIADGYSFVQGHMASATYMSMAQGHNGVIAYQTSFAQGEQASAKDRGMAQGLNANANDNSFAQGYDVTATTAAFAQGNTVKSNYYSISQGLRTSAQYYSIAQGYATLADDYSQSFGLGTKMLHSGMAIGTYNKSDNIPFVIGNGTSDDNRSDLFLINRNGDVSAKGDISAKNFYINGNPIDSIVSAKFSAYNGSTTLLTAYPISSFSLYANTAKYLNVATASNNRLDFSVADTLINSAKSGAAASAWIVSNGTTFMPKSQTFDAKGNPNNFNTTFSYTGFTLSAGSAIGFNKNGNILTISAQAGIPDGTLTYTMLYGPGGHPTEQDFNISSLNITNYRSPQNIDNINLNVTASNGSTASFALWPEDISLTARPVPATLIPIVDPTNIKQKKYMQVSDLNIGNYVSAGDNQKLTIMSAENLTLANMQPGVIYLV